MQSYFSHDAAAWVSIGCVLLMIAAPIILIYWAKFAKRPYLGTGVIYFLAISEIIPAIVILGLQQVLDKASAGTLLAGVAGYVLGGMSDSKQNPKANNNDPKSPEKTPDPSDPEAGGDSAFKLGGLAAVINRD
jgi:hypothetical protein